MLGSMEKFYLFVTGQSFQNQPPATRIIDVRDPVILYGLQKSKKIRYIPALCLKGDNYETVIYGEFKIQEYFDKLVEYQKEEIPEVLEEIPKPENKEIEKLVIPEEKLDPTPENIEAEVKTEYRKTFGPDFNDI